MIRTVYGRSKSGTALIPYFDSLTIGNFSFSTRLGDFIIDWKDGTTTNSNNTSSPINKNFADGSNFGTNPKYSKTYSSAYTGNISVKFLKGLKDVYSILLAFDHTSNQQSKLNIIDVETFFNQFPNLYSIAIADLSSGFTARMSVVKGDFSKLPDSVERVQIQILDVINAKSDVVLNLSNYSNTSKLKHFQFGLAYGFVSSSRLKLIGDFGKLPTNCQYFYLTKASTSDESAITYTAGKVWASSFDTLFLPIPLTITENDNLFIDANNSVTTAIGGKLWDLKGVRTPTSDVAVAGLIVKGFTVNCFRISDTMLTMPLSSNLLDYSSYANNASMIGTETHSLGGLVTSTGNYASIPNKTSLDIGTGSIYFGCKVKFSGITGTKGIMGKTVNASVVGRYGIFIYLNSIYGMTQLTSGTYQNNVAVATYNDGKFHSIEIICNRNLGKQEMYIDGVLLNTLTFAASNDNLVRNAEFKIGAHGSPTGTGILASSEFDGIIKDVFVYKF